MVKEPKIQVKESMSLRVFDILGDISGVINRLKSSQDDGWEWIEKR